ncbi:MAG: 5'-nucleotidase C-terminal domain-containing protein, partial [Bacteroidota bacterium]
AGIDYGVDLREKPGDRITIKSMSDGSAFDPNKKYNVSINSYRGSGGGEHLTKGVDIPHSMLESRIRWVSEKDLRSHIAEYFLQKETIEALPLNNWQAIPKDWTERAKQRDYQMLFGEKNH